MLQENTRWKALDEIYKIYMRLHRPDLAFSKLETLKKVRFFQISSSFSLIFMKFARIFLDFLEKLCKTSKFQIYQFQINVIMI